MKHRIFLAGAVALLLAVVAFMAWDIFFARPDPAENPYAYELHKFRQGDTALLLYAEARSFDPGFSPVNAICCTGDGSIIVAGAKKVAIFDSAGRATGGFPVSGTATAMFVTSAGRIWLGMEDHVEIFDMKGNRLQAWDKPADNAVITSLAAGESDTWIADAANRVVYRCDTSGEIIRKLGEKDPARGIPGLVVPSPYFDLGIFQGGELWVVNPGRHKFERYGTDGELLESWGLSSMTMEGFCGCCNPSNFAFLSDGSFVTSEKGIERVKIYWPDGTFRGVVALPSSFTEGTRGLDLAVDPNDRILLLDPARNLVRIFEAVDKQAR